MPEFLRPFAAALAADPYAYLFVGMLIVGELVLLPAVFLSVTGRLELMPVIGIAVAATLLKDFGFYYAGRRFPATALRRLPGQGMSRLVDGLDQLFRQRGAQVLFLSKFVYGTRAIAQVLAGVHDMPLRAYLVANALGVMTLTLALSALAWSVAGTTRRFADVVHGMQTGFLAFVAVAAAAHLAVALVARRRWSR